MTSPPSPPPDPDTVLRATLAEAWQGLPPRTGAERLSVGLADALLEARSRPALAADWRMAEAALGHPDALVLWQEALTLLPAPDRDTERAQVHERLAALRLAVGDRERGCRHLHAALDATPSGDAPLRLRRAATLGAQLLAAGRPPAAEAVLEEALRLSMNLEETLWILGLASTLAALRLEHGDWSAADALGRLVSEVAATRGNWLGVADGCITRSASRFSQGDLRAALEVVLQTAQDLQAVHAIAALNLLRAHLIELRAAAEDDTTFDALFDEVQAARESPPPPVPLDADPQSARADTPDTTDSTAR